LVLAPSSGLAGHRCSGRLIKIIRKSPTGGQLFRQRPGGLKPGFHGERRILFCKEGGSHINAGFQIFCRRGIGAADVVIRFRRLLRRQ
jgi:hypothetical protein